ncbi:hypothetical protein OG530_37645 [Streptomyces decoyicus]|uniref:hypothetical protein n=1 Tax=Streptomyces decoyicus TaxID=249567 RepID=UPI002E1884E8
MIRPASEPSRVRQRTSPRASATPRITDPAMATRETRRLMPSDSSSTLSWKKAEYQRRLKPLKTVRDFWLLKEKRTTTPMGR